MAHPWALAAARWTAGGVVANYPRGVYVMLGNQGKGKRVSPSPNLLSQKLANPLQWGNYGSNKKGAAIHETTDRTNLDSGRIHAGGDRAIRFSGRFPQRGEFGAATSKPVFAQGHPV